MIIPETHVIDGLNRQLAVARQLNNMALAAALYSGLELIEAQATTIAALETKIKDIPADVAAMKAELNQLRQVLFDTSNKINAANDRIMSVIATIQQ